jgi:hypothetical protein
MLLLKSAIEDLATLGKGLPSGNMKGLAGFGRFVGG